VKAKVDEIRRAWLARSPRDRAVAMALFACLGLAALALIWSAIQGERSRLQKAVPLAQARLQRMQDDSAEVVRLRGQSGAAAAQQTSPAEAINASLRSRHLDLSVAADGADRLQVHGSANFDDVIAWLATVQIDYKLHVASLSMTRAAAGVKIDAVLVAATP
jgi:type II secretory pathway component PulM